MFPSDLNTIEVALKIWMFSAAIHNHQNHEKPNNLCLLKTFNLSMTQRPNQPSPAKSLEVRNSFWAWFPHSRSLPQCRGPAGPSPSRMDGQRTPKDIRRGKKKGGISKERERIGKKQIVSFVGEQPRSTLTTRHKPQQTSAVHLARGLYSNFLRWSIQFTVLFNWNTRWKEPRNEGLPFGPYLNIFWWSWTKMGSLIHVCHGYSTRF